MENQIPQLLILLFVSNGKFAFAQNPLDGLRLELIRQWVNESETSPELLQYGETLPLDDDLPVDQRLFVFRRNDEEPRLQAPISYYRTDGEARTWRSDASEDPRPVRSRMGPKSPYFRKNMETQSFVDPRLFVFRRKEVNSPETSPIDHRLFVFRRNDLGVPQRSLPLQNREYSNWAKRTNGNNVLEDGSNLSRRMTEGVESHGFALPPPSPKPESDKLLESLWPMMLHSLLQHPN